MKTVQVRRHGTTSNTTSTTSWYRWGPVISPNLRESACPKPTHSGSEMYLFNPRAIRQPYTADLLGVMSIAAGRESRSWLSTWNLLTPTATPAWSLPKLAAALKLGSIHVKDESKRSELASFKALG